MVDKATLFSNNELPAEMFAKIIGISVAIFFVIRMLGAVFWFSIIRLINKLDSRIMSDLEQKSFWHIINLSYRFHLNKKTGSIISQFTRGVNKVESFADAFIFNFVPVTFRMILSIGVIFYFDAGTAITLLVMTIIFIFVGVYITNKQKIPQNTANYNEDILKQNLSDVFLNIETVKYFGKENRTFNYFSGLSKKLKESRMVFWNYFSWHAGIQTVVLGIGLSSIFYISFTGFLNGRITLGSITLIYAAVWKLIPQLFGLIHGYREFVRSSVDVNALFSMFKEENEVKDQKNAKPLKVKNGEIEFKEVFFAYPKGKSVKQDQEAVIKNFDLKIKKNKKIALVGPSGSGKTTIVKLLYRLFDLNEGKILIDGQDIAEVTQNSLRNSMSIVPQEPILFDNTIYFNIAYANPKAKNKQVWQAIKFAQLDKFIERLGL